VHVGGRQCIAANSPNTMDAIQRHHRQSTRVQRWAQQQAMGKTV
jgi:hypothetical protein